MNNSQDKRERTLFVSTIHRSITDDDLYEIMRQAGPIEKIKFKEDTDGTPMHALVIFRNVESVVFSMRHLLPIVKNTGLIQIRPLRESSHNYLPGAGFHYSTMVKTAGGMPSRNMFNHLNHHGDIVSWTNQQLSKLYDMAFTLPFHSHGINNVSPCSAAKATCAVHDFPPHSVKSKSYPTQTTFVSQNLPVNCISSRGSVECSNLSITHSSMFRSTHRGRCSKICCAKT